MSNDITQIFSDIYHTNHWRDNQSLSGPGSNLEATNFIRKQIPIVLSKLDVHSVLDIPCGDYHWWSKMSLSPDITYIGADIVPEIVSNNRTQYPEIDFQVMDIITDDLPDVDLVFCRDCLGHLSNIHVSMALNNIRASGSFYLLATHFPDPKWSTSLDITDGYWRPINLDKQFGLGKPILTISEQLTIRNGAYKDKCLALWRLNE